MAASKKTPRGGQRKSTRRDTWLGVVLVGLLATLVAFGWWRAEHPGSGWHQARQLPPPSPRPLPMNFPRMAAASQGAAAPPPVAVAPPPLVTAPVTAPALAPTAPPARSVPALAVPARQAVGIIYEEHFSHPQPEPPAVSPLPEPSPSPATAPGGTGQRGVPLALIIDDLGYQGPVSRAIAQLPADVTLAILPDGPHARDVAAIGSRLGKEIILHQPMEPGNPAVNPGPSVLRVSHDEATIRRLLRHNLERFPEAVGINNHMGSLLTRHARPMAVVMEELARRGLYFIDSRTTPETVAYAQAEAAGVPRAGRDVFIDNVHDVAYIRRQLEKLERVAILRGGDAIGIGHPYPETLDAIRGWLEGLPQRGLRLVRASRFLSPVSARRHYPAAPATLAGTPGPVAGPP